MIKIYKTIDGKIEEIESIEKNSWINMVKPTEEELLFITKELGVDPDFRERPWMKKKFHV